jgi:transcriptional regulator with XRE-family HTH domain
MKALREELGWSQERLGVAIGIDESSSRARISRYELGVHEPPIPTARLIAKAMEAPLAYLYCDDEDVGMLILTLHRLDATLGRSLIRQFFEQTQKDRLKKFSNESDSSALSN